MRKATFYICENKDADQLRGDRSDDPKFADRLVWANSAV